LSIKIAKEFSEVINKDGNNLANNIQFSEKETLFNSDGDSLSSPKSHVTKNSNNKTNVLLQGAGPSYAYVDSILAVLIQVLFCILTLYYF
jgi:hypothetical protein